MKGKEYCILPEPNLCSL